ncbi:hypothetical protein MNBD_ACTINO02-677 [hydrothermal vent metagenome]|uniref:DUF1648 domain-containing protein n=1 Tax=hydrothermal vent metagenome TaxID=652676 RepID=A0A3B0T468_9ZZZZ
MNDRAVASTKLLLWLPGVIAVVLLAAPFALRDRLPDPLAIHWDLSGAPNGFGPLIVIALVSSVAVAIAWVVFLRTNRVGMLQSHAGAMVWFLAILMGGMEAFTIAANLDRATWQDAGNFGPGRAAVLVVLAGLIGFGVWRVLGGNMSDPGVAIGPAPSAGIELGEHAVWVGKTAAAKGFVGIALVVTVGAAVAAVLRLTPVVTLSLVVTALPLLLFVSLRARVSSTAVTVWMGIFGVPRVSYPLARIVRAEVIDVRPLAYGGWGFRIIKGARAWIVRGGEGIRLVRPETSDIVITVDGAAGAAGLINDILMREGRFVAAESS